jgi:hypothetical protein
MSPLREGTYGAEGYCSGTTGQVASLERVALFHEHGRISRDPEGATDECDFFCVIRQLRSFFCCMFCDRPRQKVRFCTAIIPRRYSIKDRNDILRNQPGEAPLLKPHRGVGSCGPVQQVVYGIMANSAYNPKCWASWILRGKIFLYA